MVFLIPLLPERDDIIDLGITFNCNFNYQSYFDKIYYKSLKNVGYHTPVEKEYIILYVINLNKRPFGLLCDI